jgi:hypothetical protein
VAAAQREISVNIAGFAASVVEINQEAKMKLDPLNNMVFSIDRNGHSDEPGGNGHTLCESDAAHKSTSGSRRFRDFGHVIISIVTAN